LGGDELFIGATYGVSDCIVVYWFWTEGISWSSNMLRILYFLLCSYSLSFPQLIDVLCDSFLAWDFLIWVDLIIDGVLIVGT
jgi:hypothetical protein